MTGYIFLISVRGGPLKLTTLTIAGTQEWTRLPVQTGPIGRYGHAVCMANSRFFVFAGQGEGEFLNDLWSYDIRQR